MKYKIDELRKEIRNALLDVNGANVQVVLDGIKLIQESSIPLFNDLRFVDVEIKDGKDLQYTVHLLSKYEGNNYKFNLNVVGNELIIKDDEQNLELTLGESRRIAKFRYFNDIIYVEVNKDYTDKHCSINIMEDIKKKGGYTGCNIEVYTNAYGMENASDKLDVSKLDPDCNSLLYARKEYNYDSNENAKFFDDIFYRNYIEANIIEKRLNKIFWIGILKRDDFRRNHMRAFEGMAPKSK